MNGSLTQYNRHYLRKQYTRLLIFVFRNFLLKKPLHYLYEKPLLWNLYFDIDHIIPQSYFKNDNTDPCQKEALCNLAILPSPLNKSKKDKLPSAIPREDHELLEYYEKIPAEMLNFEIEPSDFGKLLQNREEWFREVFDKKRNNWLKDF